MSSVKYGLQIRAKTKKANPLPAKPVKLAAFEDDEYDGVESQIAREALKKRSNREILEQHEAAKAQDASVFEYDSVYDQIKGAQSKPKLEEKMQRQSKYIPSLLEKAKVRVIEQEIVRERILIKEREKEDDLFGDKEKFVTRAYKEKLAEQAKWLQEEKRLAEIEAANDVTKKEDFGDFYRNILDRKSDREFGMKAASEKLSTIEPESKQEDKMVVEAVKCEPLEDKEECKNVAEAPLTSAKSQLDVGGQVNEDVAVKEEVVDIEQKQKKDTEEKLHKMASARERYLARKKQKT